MFFKISIFCGLLLTPIITTNAQTTETDQVTISFVVKTPTSTPEKAELYLSGNTASLGEWDGKGLKLTRQENGVYVGQATLIKGQQIAYKVTRGGWDKVEKDAAGQEISNRTIDAASDLTAQITVLAWADQFEQERAVMTSTITGHVQIFENIKSKYLELPRTVRIYLPPGYGDASNASQHYPVLYMHDGQNLFDVKTSAFGVEWQVDENAERLINEGKIEPLIVVGIDNTAHRTLEYTPTHDAKRNGGGGGADYAKFLIEELKPWIDEKYRTRPEAKYTGTAGSSLGGLISLYLGSENQGVFTRIGSVSPALGWDKEWIVRDWSDNRDAYAPWWQTSRVWVDMGTLESSIGGGGVCTVELAEEITNIMQETGMQQDQQYKLFVVENGQHNEAAWANRIADILMYLYPKEIESK